MTATAAARTRPARVLTARWAGLWPLAPVLLFLALFFVYPVAQLLLLSVRTPAGDLTGQHYLRLASDPVYLSVLAITFKIAAWTTVIAVLGGYPAAYLLATASADRRNRLVLWVLLPFWTSFLVRTFAWMILLGHSGAINRLLIAAGLTRAPLALTYNLTGTLIGMAHALMPLAILTMLSVMQTIDPRYGQAADTLGGRPCQRFWRIYVPQSMPGVSAAAIMVFITALGFFITPALLGGAHETMITQVIITQVQELLNWSFAGALAVALLAAALLVFLLYDRLVGSAALTGAAASGAPARRSALAAAGAALGRRLVGLLGDGGAVLGEAWDRVRPWRPGPGAGRWALSALFALTAAFLVLPALLVVPASFTAGRVVELPPAGLSLRWYQAYLAAPEWIAATVNSVVIATVSGLLALVLGGMAAFALVRRPVPGRSALLGLLLSPLIVPRIVIAVALFYLYSRLELVGTLTGLVLGHTVLALPYVVITVMAVLGTYDSRYDQAAHTLGADPWRTLWRITLPQIRGGLIAAFLFAFITSFDELTVSLFVTGGAVTTLPRQMWSDMLLQINPTLAAAATVLLVVMTLLLLAGETLRRRGRA